jgi:hypothetical protein
MSTARAVEAMLTMITHKRIVQGQCVIGPVDLSSGLTLGRKRQMTTIDGPVGSSPARKVLAPPKCPGPRSSWYSAVSVRAPAGAIPRTPSLENHARGHRTGQDGCVIDQVMLKSGGRRPWTKPGQPLPNRRRELRKDGKPPSSRSRATWIRRGRDSNPRWSFPHTAFPVLHNRPLCHLSDALNLIWTPDGASTFARDLKKARSRGCSAAHNHSQ